jgi:FtsH-binding integral membrane protein
MDDPRFDRTQVAVSDAGAEIRSRFITRTYGHLLGAVGGLVAFEVMLFQSGMAESIMRVIGGTSWLLVLGAYLVVGWIATHVAHTARSKAAQYFALASYVAAVGIIFVPLLMYAQIYEPKAIPMAALVTVLGFTGLSGVVFLTRQNFSFLGSLVWWGGIVSILLIAASVIFGFQLGTWFFVGMIALAGGMILYDTSNVLHHYPEDRYVGASLQLFASVALLFWYVLRLFMSRD